MIRLVDTFLLDESDWLIVLRRHWPASFAWLFKSAKVGQKSFFEKAVLELPVLGELLLDFDRVNSNFSPTRFTSTYPREIFDRTTPLKLFIN